MCRDAKKVEQGLSEGNSNDGEAMDKAPEMNDRLSQTGVQRAWWWRGLADMGLAFGLLTRIPLPQFDVGKPVALERAVWVFPIVGAVVGGVGAIGFELVRVLGLSEVVACVVALLLMVLISGGLHEDGLADFWDGIGGGSDRETRLRIMRDSRIGSYGVMALGFVLVLQGALLFSLAGPEGAWPMWAVIISVACVSRAALLLPMGLLLPARATGLGAGVAGASGGLMVLGFFISAFLVVGLLGFIGALLVFLGAFILSGVVCLMAQRYLGGQTGDVLGACASMSMVGSLAALAVGASFLVPMSGAHP